MPVTRTISATYSKAAALTGGSGPSLTVSVRNPFTFTDGIGADQADKLYVATRTLAAGVAFEDVDIYGVLLDAFGDLFSPAKIKYIYVRPWDTNVDDLVLGGAASNAWLGPFETSTSKIRVAPGDVFEMPCRRLAGWPVTAGTADLLRAANSAGAGGAQLKYDILLAGTSA